MSMQTEGSEITRSNVAYAECPSEGKDRESSEISNSSSEDEDACPRCSQHQMSGRSQLLYRGRLSDIILTIIVTLLTVIGAAYFYRLATFSADEIFNNTVAAHYSEAARLNPKYQCGSSAAEAISLGCVFDLSLVGYVPAPCFDADLNQRFMDWGWKFFEDQNGTIEVSVDRIAASAGTREPFWAQHGYHITHCELAWERMHRALQGGRRLTTHMLNLEHTKHCGMMTEMRDDFYSLNSQILPLLNTC